MTTIDPTLRVLSLGAGRQSTTLLMLSAEGKLPKLDAAIFADTGWEPKAVYRHLDRLEEEVAKPAGIPIYRVRTGNLRDDVLNPNKMRNIPAFTASRAYEVEVVDEWKLCPDGNCGWRELRKVRGQFGDLVLFDDQIDTSDMQGLFDSVVMVPERATIAELEALTRQELARRDHAAAAEGDVDADEYLYESTPIDNSPVPSWQVADALRRAGLDRLPEPHTACKSMGIVAARSHTEIQRDFGKQRRGCTQQYKLRPVLEQVRLLLGAPVQPEKVCHKCDGTGERVAPWRAKRGEDTVAECSVCEGMGVISRVGQPPKDRWAEQWIGFSSDEILRVSTRGDTRYSRSRHPLIELDMTVQQCLSYLSSRGWDSVEKSSCTGCPMHGNAHWRKMRDQDPESWADAVAFDREYREGAGMRHERFLHISCLPLDQAPIDKVRPIEFEQSTVAEQLYDLDLAEEGPEFSCSPWACRSSDPDAA